MGHIHTHRTSTFYTSIPWSDPNQTAVPPGAIRTRQHEIAEWSSARTSCTTLIGGRGGNYILHRVVLVLLLLLLLLLRPPVRPSVRTTITSNLIPRQGPRGGTRVSSMSVVACLIRCVFQGLQPESAGFDRSSVILCHLLFIDVRWFVIIRAK